MTPNENTMEETIRDQRRPIRSAIIAAPRAPKKVPAERIETISEVWEDVIAGCSTPFASGNL
jgi:hypothetical protein